MNPKRGVLRVAPMLIVFGLAAPFLWWLASGYHYGVDPDGISYLQLADQWATGNWRHGISPYWGPMLSLLMILPRALGVGDTGSFTVVNTIALTLLIVGSFGIVRRFGHRTWLAMLVAAAIAFRVVIWAISFWSPDLLLASITFIAIVVGLRILEHESRRGWIALGVTCGTLYLAKPVGLLTGALIIGIIWFLVSWPWREAFLPGHLRRLGLATVAWFLTVLPWMVVISIDAGKLTYGSSGTYNLYLTQAPYPIHPFLADFYHPSFPGATSIWTEPTSLPATLPFSLLSTDFLRLIWRNLQGNWHFLRDQELRWIVVFVVVAVAQVVVPVFRRDRRFWLLLAVTVIQFAVYLPLLLEKRYLWGSSLLLCLIAILMVARLLQSVRIGAIAAIAAVAVSLLGLFPGTSTAISTGQSPVPMAMEMINNRDNEGRHIQIWAREFPNLGQTCPTIAGYDGQPNNQPRLWRRTNYFAWETGVAQIGVIQPTWSPQEADAKLTAFDVRCLAVWDGADLPGPIADRATFYGESADQRLVIYRLAPADTLGPQSLGDAVADELGIGFVRSLYKYPCCDTLTVRAARDGGVSVESFPP